jgi:hypothetical protein
MNIYRETPEQVVERELAYWRDEQQLAAEFADSIEYNRRAWRGYLMQDAPTETLPLPRIGCLDILLAVVRGR